MSKANSYIISLDFDGVLAQGFHLKVKYAKKWFGLDLEADQTKEIGFNELVRKKGLNLNYDRDLTTKLNAEHILEFLIAPNLIETLTKMYGEGCRFVIVTSRSDRFLYAAKLFVENNFGGLIDYIHNTNRGSKNYLTTKLKARLHIDDDLKKIIQLVDTPLDLFYFRQIENKYQDIQSELKNRIYEFSDWREFYRQWSFLKLVQQAIAKKYNLPNNMYHCYEILKIQHALNHKQRERLVEQQL